MRKVQLTHHIKGNFNYFFTCFNDIFTGVADPVRLKGYTRIIAFDKMLNSGENVNVAYEMNQKSIVKYKIGTKRDIVPLFE